MASTPTPPPEDRIRLTISVSPQVHDTFQRMAAAGGMSLSRAMGDWLDDTSEAALLMVTTMERARRAPRLMARELQALAGGFNEEVGALITSLRKRELPAAGVGAALPRPRTAAASPPSSNTGGKVPRTRGKPVARKARP